MADADFEPQPVWSCEQEHLGRISGVPRPYRRLDKET